MKHTFIDKYLPYLKALGLLGIMVGITFTQVALAGDAGGGGTASDQGVGALAAGITKQFKQLGNLIFGIAFLAGIGFVMAAIFKFKQHKDNPQQIPLGTPIAMLVIGAILIFLPSLIAPLGVTIYGADKTPGGFQGGGVTTIPGAGS